jgi:uncharacterized protein YlxW (UPF0749 family)
VFDEADTNDDGYVDEEEAKLANLDLKTTEKLNQLNKQVEGIVDTFKQYYSLNSEQSGDINSQINKIKKLSMELGSLKDKKDDDNTITYF